jgi:chorismate mutase
LQKRFPDLPLIIDPSHITGDREMILEVTQQALDLNYDGMIIETHDQIMHGRCCTTSDANSFEENFCGLKLELNDVSDEFKKKIGNLEQILMFLMLHF